MDIEGWCVHKPDDTQRPTTPLDARVYLPNAHDAHGCTLHVSNASAHAITCILPLQSMHSSVHACTCSEPGGACSTSSEQAPGLPPAQSPQRTGWVRSRAPCRGHASRAPPQGAGRTHRQQQGPRWLVQPWRACSEGGRVWVVPWRSKRGLTAWPFSSHWVSVEGWMTGS